MQLFIVINLVFIVSLACLNTFSRGSHRLLSTMAISNRVYWKDILSRAVLATSKQRLLGRNVSAPERPRIHTAQAHSCSWMSATRLCTQRMDSYRRSDTSLDLTVQFPMPLKDRSAWQAPLSAGWEITLVWSRNLAKLTSLRAEVK